jgi:hypothetical protein
MNTRTSSKLIAAAGVVTLSLGLAACGSSSGPAVPRPTVTVTHTVTAKPAPVETHPAAPKAVKTPALPGVQADWAMNPATPVVKPDTIYTAADGSGILSGITWSSWTAVNAEGSGSINLNNCDPNCAQGTVVDVPVSIGLIDPVNGSFNAMTVTDHAGNTNTYSLSDNSTDTDGLNVDDPAPAAAAAPSPGNSPAAGAPSCTTVSGYYPGGMAGHLNSSGFCVPDGMNGNT